MRARELVGRSVRPRHLGVSTCCGDGATAAHMQTHVPWHARASTTLEMRLPGQSQVVLSGCEKVQWQNMRARSRKVLKVTCPAPTLTVRADEAQHEDARPVMRVCARAVRPEHPWSGPRRENPMR